MPCVSVQFESPADSLDLKNVPYEKLVLNALSHFKSDLFFD